MWRTSYRPKRGCFGAVFVDGNNHTYDMRTTHLIVNGKDVQYAEQGTGPVTLLLHGWGTNLHTFDELVKSWNPTNNRLIAIDLPGFGDSELPTAAWDVAAYVTFVRSFLNKLEIDEPDLIIGHSLGGRIAIKGVASNVFKPNKLVLVAAAGTAKTRSLRNRVFMIIAKIGKVVMSIPPLSIFKSTFRKKLYAAAGSTDYLNAGNMKATFLNIVQENLTDAAKKITIPTLLVWGDQDTETPLHEAETLHQAIHGSKLHVVPHAGHFVHIEQPQEVAHHLITFTTL